MNEDTWVSKKIFGFYLVIGDTIEIRRDSDKGVYKVYFRYHRRTE